MKNMNSIRNSKGLKRAIALAFCAILLTIQFSVAAVAEDVEVVYATIDIQLHKNWIKSKYDVTVYFDGIEVDTMIQGDLLTFGAYMRSGDMHELRFDAHKDGVPDRCWTIGNLQHGSALTCQIQTKRDQVKIREHSLSVDSKAVFSVAPDIERQVRIAGTVIVTAIKIAQAANQ